jgi:hypothetical protein
VACLLGARAPTPKALEPRRGTASGSGGTARVTSWSHARHLLRPIAAGVAPATKAI